MGNRNSRVGSGGDAGGDSWYDLERHRRIVHCLRFFAPTSEHEWIAALQADDAFPVACELDEQLVDLVLGHRDLRAAAFADVVKLGPAGGARAGWEQHRVRESVVDDGVGRVDQLLAANGDET